MHSESYRILLVGNGGREHALAWKLSQSSKVSVIYNVPGNGGTARLPKVRNVAVEYTTQDFAPLIRFARDHEINLVVPGPEIPLVAGIANALSAVGIRCFGPSKAAARMEGSKTFSKDFMARRKIPTAEFGNFNDYDLAKRYLDEVTHGVVVKASGLAGGKGVILPKSKEEAHAALKEIMLDRGFGAAGDEVVIEEYLEGEELSFLTFSDGYTIRSLPPAQDHKQIYDGDHGPNTGGMGCYAPTPVGTQQLIDEVHRTILQPTIDGMRKEGFPFVGLLFTGLMITETGPKALEYNVRFGDPETQTLLPLMSADTDLAEIMVACTDHYLDTITLNIDPKFSATVVASAANYPGKPTLGDTITLDPPPSDTLIFHAGTILTSDTLKTSGGRVIAATSTASTLEAAISLAYRGISTIHYPKMHYRTDIGHRALRRPKSNQTKNGQPMTYASAGVDINAGNDLVKRITPLVKATSRAGADGSLGGFGGTFDLAAAGYKEPPVLVSGTDGVGTKLKIAHAVGKHDTVGIDLVAMNVNDLIVQGATPLFFLDVYTTGKLDVDIAYEVIKGITQGCTEAGCTLVGGETAEMHGLLASEEDYDIAGTTVGAIPQGQKILPFKDEMTQSDTLLGVASNGCHSNGFSLIRKIVAQSNLQMTDPAPWETDKTIGESLLTPTRIYVRSILKIISHVKGMAHITGGGLLENIPRTLPKHLAALLNVNSWPVPPVMQWLKKAGNMEHEEFARVFNTGLGMVLVVSPDEVGRVMGLLKEAGESVYVVGRLIEIETERCVLDGLEAWD